MLEAFASVISICVDVSQCLFSPVRGPFSYLWNYNNNFKRLEQEVKNLTEARERLRHRVDDAERKGEAIEQDVQTWLTSVDEIIDEAGMVIGDEAQAQSYCLKGLCPNLKTRYQISKNAATKVEAITELQEKGRFEEVSYRTVPQETWIPASKGYESFESRTTTLKDIQKALSDPKVNMVGVYGMGGIGKTTLVQDIAMQAEKDKLFHEVVFAHVSQTPDIKKIQGEIADKLGLEFREETESGRARKLRERLSGKKKILSDNIPTDTDMQITLLEDGDKGSKKLLTEKMETESRNKRKQELSREKKILVILDNIWTDLDLFTVGIPHGDDNMGCKLLLTARNLDVLTSKMNCDNNFQVGILDEQEAWRLFKKMAGDCIENHDLQPIAVDVAKECRGLPIAIVTIARALRNRGLHQWRDALNDLRNPSGRNLSAGVQAEAYSTIELSYTYLEDDELRSAFLLCSLMDDDDFVLNLLKYGIGWGLFQGVKKMEGARDKMHTLLDKLKDSCLLLDGQTNESFSMHDVVRDVALSIACRDRHVFSVRDETALIRWPDKNRLENCTAITLLKCNVSELPGGLECPELRFMYIRNPGSSVKIPVNFFNGMTKLKGLHLTGMQLVSLPSSICLLQNLRTLCLDHCQLGDIAILGELKDLEILSFISSNIEQLPKEIGQLSCLKLLDLSNCCKLKVIPPDLISSLSQLEELYMCNTLIQWDDKGTDTEKRNASLHELKHLSHLTNLEIHIEDADILPKGLFSKNLERYRIFIGHQQYWPYHESYKCARILKLKLNTNISMKDIMQLEGIEVLYLDEVPGVKNVLYEVDKKGFPHLKHLNVQNNPYLLCIVDSMQRGPHEAFPVLESLLLSNLIKLEKICHGQLTAESFCKLTSIKVDNCDKLKNIFSFSIVKSLPQLEIIEVFECKALEDIFAIGREDDVNNDEEIGKIELSKLRSVTLKALPHLTSFYSKVKIPAMSQETVPTDNEVPLEDQHDTPTTLFNDMVVLPKMEALEVYEINCENIWQNQFSVASSSFQNLTRLIVHRCGKLNFLFPYYIVRSFLKLQHLEICECPALNEIIAMEEFRGEEREDMKFPQLNFLIIRELANLTRFCLESYVEFPSLKKLNMIECPKFKAFVVENLSRDLTDGEEVGQLSLVEIQPFFNEKVAFLDLEEMVITYLDDMKMIWNSSTFAHNSFGKLKSLDVFGCDKLQTLFPSDMLGRFPRLESLSINNCQSLKNIFPASISRGLLQLEVLKIIGCGLLEEIVAKEEGEEPSTISFVFPNVTCLVLQALTGLTTFYPGVYTTEWPALENLEMLDFENVKVFASDFQDQPDNSAQQPFFSVQKIFPRLKVLELRNIMMICQNSQFSRHLFSKINTLIIFNDIEAAVIPLGFLERFCNLERLTLLYCSCKELFSYEEVDNFASNFAQIKYFQNDFLCDRKHMLKQDSRMNPILQNLEILSVKGCWNLIKLLPSSSSFQNLSTLQVCECERMINMVSSSTAKSLEQLRELQIEKCKKITEIVENEEDNAEVEIVFSKLEKLSLVDVESLTSFCSANYTFKFPALAELSVSGCPKMKIFCGGALSTPILWRVLLNGEQYFLEGDLNRTIQLFHNKLVLEVSVIEFEKISPYPTMSSRFQNLKRLTVQGFGNLKYLFQSSVVRSFLQLQHLEIRMCPVLNEIIAIEEFREEERKAINFPQLNFLRIEELENLSRFCFENSVEFPSLKKFEMKKCPKFKAFVLENLSQGLSTGEEVDNMSLKEIQPFFNEKAIFPCLEEMVISHLDDLKMIWHNNKLAHNSFSKLESIEVEGCDKLLTLLPSNMLGSLSKLWSLTVSDCGSLEEIFGVQGSNFEETYSMPKFCLRSMDVTKCQSLKSIFPASIAMGLLRLTSLHLSDCRILEEIVAKGGGRKPSAIKFVFPKLFSISVFGCNKLQTLFSSNILGRFIRLRYLSVSECQNLRNIFPVSTAKSLLQLERFQINRCDKLEVIVTKEERGEPSVVRFVFPKVTRLALDDLPELSTFYPGVHTTEWPALENLKMYNCEKLKVFGSKSSDFQETKNGDQLDNSSQPLIFSVQKIFPRLKVLELRKNIMMLCPSQFPRHLFSKLTTLRITEKEAAVFPLALLEIFDNLKTLELFYGSYKELFSYEEVEKNVWNFSRIKSLHLQSLSNLKHLWKHDSRMNSILGNLESLSVKFCANLVELVPSSSCFQNLTTLEVYRCRGMINLVTSTTAKSLEQLQEMRIERCESITEVVANEGEVAEDEIVFTKLEKLSLVGLESLTSFCSALYTFEFPALEGLTVSDCPKMNVFCKGVLSTSKLERVWLNREPYLLEGDLNRIMQQTVLEVSADEYEKIWQIQLSPEMSSHFQNLQRLIVQGCDNLNYLFPSSIVRSFLQLQHLEICKCSVLNEIITMEEITEEERKEIKFPKLNFLRIEELENLTRFCLENYVEFPSLKKLEMKQCPKLKVFVLENMRSDLTIGEEVVKMSSMDLQPFFNDKVAFPKLTEILFSDLDDLMIIWHSNKLAHNSFGKLIKIKVEGCDKLLTLFPLNMLRRFSRLQYLTVTECGSLEEIFGIQGSNFGEAYSVPDFDLEIMSVTKCQSLKNIFPAYIVKRLLRLRNLQIVDCGMLEEIVSKDGGGEPSTVNFVFPRLFSLELKNLAALTDFYPGVNTSKWPMLKWLEVYGCEKVRVFDSKFLNFQKTKDEGHLIPAQQSFFVEEIIPYLEKLTLSSQEIMMICHGLLPGHLFSNLKALGIKDDESAVFPLGLLEKFCNVDELTLSHGSYKELFSYEEMEKHVGSLARIKKLLLESLSDLKYMWKQQESKLNSILQNLGILNVKYCDSLIILLPTSASFQNLTTLKVCYCKGMINFVTSSTAKSLERLREMSVEGCRGMTEIVSDEGDVAEDEIVFSKLEELSLVDLESLRSLCSVNHTFNFPSLNVLIVRDCPKMKIFCEGALSTPKLEMVRQNREEWRLDKGYWEGDLNTTIQLLHKKKVLEVSAIEFENIWQSQFPTMSACFQNLERLVVQGYGNLNYLFTSSIARSFLQLKHLEICKCPVLEEIMVMEEASEDVQKNIMFPQLKFLKLEDLQNLTKFCTEYIEFSSLKQLHIEHCPKFKAFVLEIMSRDLTGGEEVVKLRSTELETFFNHKAAFPNLEEMVISHLDGLKMIWHNNKLVHNTFPKLKSITVEGCDKLLTLFPANMLGRLSRVESVTVNECGSLEAIFGFQGSRFEERLLMPIFKLKHVSVSKCHGLKNVFQLSIARSLLELFELKIIDCGKLEEIVAMEGGGEPSNTKFVFPQVASLVLKNLPALTNFYPGVHTSEWPVLKELLLYGCHKVKVFDSEFLNYQKADDEGQLDIPTQQPFFLVEKIIPNLKSLRLNSQDIMMIWQGMFPGHLFSKLKALAIKDEKSAVFPLGLLEKFCNVDELTLSHGSYKELFSFEEVEKHVGSLARIKKLLLESLSDLKYIWRQDSKMNLILQNLESLKVEYCDFMINLVPPSSSFQNLMILKVCYCKGMVNLITSSTAKSLEQLREISIEGCKGMTEIVADEGDVAEDEIVFNKLEELSLVGLENLSSFCSASHTFNFPSLEVLIVRDCPKMNIFCEGALSTSMLKTVCQNWEEYWKFDKRCWEGDLNTTIQRLHNKMNFQSSIEDSGQPSVQYPE